MAKKETDRGRLTPPPLRQRQKEETRRVILDAAYVLFAEQGYERTTMRLLARRAGVGLGTIFKHFPDKPSLLAAAFLEDIGGVIGEGFATLPASGLKAQLLHLTGKIYAFYGANPLFSRVLVKEALFLKGEHGDRLDQQLNDFLAAIAELFRRATAQGEFAVAIPPEQGALAYGSFYLSGLVLGLKQPQFDVEAQLALVGSLLDGLLLSPGD